MKKIIDSVVNFFKTLGQKDSGIEPINENWPTKTENRQADPLTISSAPKTETLKTYEIGETEKETLEEGKEEATVEEPAKIELTPTIPDNEEPTLPEEIKALQTKYPWRSLKAKEPLPRKNILEPFYFIGKDKQPVPANRSEMSFVKELLNKAADAGIPNKFAFTSSNSNEIIIKYRYKLLGRAFLHGRKHRMTFKVDGSTFIVDNLSMAQCKKLLLIWLGQIKEATKSKEKAA